MTVVAHQTDPIEIRREADEAINLTASSGYSIHVWKGSTATWQYEITTPTGETIRSVLVSETGVFYTRRGAERNARRLVKSMIRRKADEAGYTVAV